MGNNVRRHNGRWLIGRGTTGWIAALALLLAACGPGSDRAADRPPGLGDDPIAVVLAWWEARNTFDHDAMSALMSGEALANPFVSRDEVEAARHLERVVTPLECVVGAETPSLGTFITCDVSVDDIIVGAAGVTSTNLNQATFRVRDGFVVAAPVWIPSSQVAEAAIERWGRTHLPLEYQWACPAGIAGQSSIDGRRCARFIAGHQESWRDEVAALGLDGP